MSLNIIDINVNGDGELRTTTTYFTYRRASGSSGGRRIKGKVKLLHALIYWFLPAVHDSTKVVVNLHFQCIIAVSAMSVYALCVLTKNMNVIRLSLHLHVYPYYVSIRSVFIKKVSQMSFISLSLSHYHHYIYPYLLWS